MWGFCPETWELYLSPALSPQSMLGLRWRSTGPPLSYSHACAWPRMPLIQTPTCRLTSQPDLRPALTLWTCLAIVGPDPNPDLQICFPRWPWASLLPTVLPLGWTWPPSQVCPARLAQVLWKWAPASEAPSRPSKRSPSAPSPSGRCWPLRLPGTRFLQLGCCAEGRVPGGEGSQPAATVKDLDCLPLKRTRKKLPLDLVFPDAQLMTGIAAAWQIPLLLVNTLLFDSRGRTTGSWPVW